MDRELKIDPPIHGKNCLSGGPITLIFVVEGISVCNYLDALSVVPGNIVEPPDKMTLAYKSFLTSKSHFMID